MRGWTWSYSSQRGRSSPAGGRASHTVRAPAQGARTDQGRCSGTGAGTVESGAEDGADVSVGVEAGSEDGADASADMENEPGKPGAAQVNCFDSGKFLV